MQSVMFIPLGFYNYDAKIEKEIRNLGYEVTRFIPIGNYNTVEKLINAAGKGRYLKHKTRTRQKKYLLGNDKRYDYVFVIVGRHLDYDLLKEYRRRQPQAKFILYLWDDIERVEGYEKNKECYDEIYSFDLRDAEQYGIKHLPLFYTDVHDYHGEDKKYVLNLSGIIHSERLKIWDDIVTGCNLDADRCFLFLLGTEMKHFFQAVLPSRDRWMKKKYIHVRGMKMEKMAEIMKRSKVTLDVQFGSQAGLTMRTMESLGTHTKLITTNPYVKEYDFYEYGNIYLIDREHPVVPQEFFLSDYREIPKRIVEKYSLSNWVSTMFGKAENKETMESV